MSDLFDRPESAAQRSQRPSPIKLDLAVCEKAGVCAMVCPEDVFVHKDGYTHIANGAACTECWICVENCASQALSIA
jgi:NAD-dependent dihydropyrimidine dehydrogenase PreA subunit